MANHVGSNSGPRTKAGKKRTRGNATRHGLLSTTVALLKSETAYSWQMHLRRCNEDLRPAGYIQQVLAERIAMLLWRQARVIRYEAGSIESSQDALAPFTIDATEGRADVVLPETTILEKVHVYEAHLSREFGRAMREFDACRARDRETESGRVLEMVPIRDEDEDRENSF